MYLRKAELKSWTATLHLSGRSLKSLTTPRAGEDTQQRELSSRGGEEAR